MEIVGTLLICCCATLVFCYGANVTTDARSRSLRSRHRQNDSLVDMTTLRDFGARLIDEMTSPAAGAERLTSQQADLLRDKLRDLYRRIPDDDDDDERLRKQRRLEARRKGRRRGPNDLASTASVAGAENTTPTVRRNPGRGRTSTRKRKLVLPRQSYSWLDIEHPACPSKAGWHQLRTAVDINNTVVVVYQPDGYDDHADGNVAVLRPPLSSSAFAAAADRLPPGTAGEPQWFYTVTCHQHRTASTADGQSRQPCPGCCYGVDHARFNSACRQKQSYVRAVVRRPDQRSFVWNWIQVNSSCNCALTPKNTD